MVMKLNLNKQTTAIVSFLFLSIGLIFSCDVFAAPNSTKFLPQLPEERFEAVLKVCGNSETPQWEACTYSIGDIGPAGGFVFFLGYEWGPVDGLHGYEAADGDTSADWGCFGTEITGADNSAVGAGAQNTADILSDCTMPAIAAHQAYEHVQNGNDDWYLPSLDELVLMYDNIGQGASNVGGFVDGLYWSSTEADSQHAWALDFTDRELYMINKDTALNVRFSRTF